MFLKQNKYDNLVWGCGLKNWADKKDTSFDSDRWCQMKVLIQLMHMLKGISFNGEYH